MNCDRARARQIRIRLTSAQLDQLDAEAARVGLPTQLWALQRLRAASGLPALVTPRDLDPAAALSSGLEGAWIVRVCDEPGHPLGDEAGAFRAAAQFAGLTLSAWIRAVLA